ncbi:MAG TPA: hypothetical protein VGV92_08705 [Gammaproteobacteria bacterium]|nr:hypothetical protein [Gammaproteobacteria bacterium]
MLKYLLPLVVLTTLTGCVKAPTPLDSQVDVVHPTKTTTLEFQKPTQAPPQPNLSPTFVPSTIHNF